MVGFICCNATVPFEALCCAVVGAVLRVVFSVPYACMLLHCICVLVLSVCVVRLPHYCDYITQCRKLGCSRSLIKGCLRGEEGIFLAV